MARRLRTLEALCLGAGLLVAATAPGRIEFGTVHAGEPRAIASAAISRAGEACPALVSAVRLDDGSIRASCNNGERYRIAAIDGVEVSLQCRRAQPMGIPDC